MSLNRDRDDILRGEKEPLSSSYVSSYVSSYASSIKRMQESHARICGPDYFNIIDKNVLHAHFFPYLAAYEFLSFSVTNKSNYETALQYSGHIELVNSAKIKKIAWLREARLETLDDRYKQVLGINLENKPLELGNLCATGWICCIGSAFSGGCTAGGISLMTTAPTSCMKITFGVTLSGIGITLGFATIAGTFFFGTEFANRCFRDREKNQIEEEIKSLEIRKSI